jgi:hypothetical protein
MSVVWSYLSDMQNALFSVLHYIAICGLSGPAMFFHIISQKARYQYTLPSIKCVVWCSVQISCKAFPSFKNSAMYHHDSTPVVM